MQHVLEIILGLPRGFLSRPGELSINFNPAWPFQQTLGAGFWNFVLVVLGAAMLYWACRRDARTTARRITLATLRAMLLAIVLILLNRPVLVLGNNRTERSVLAVMFDDSLSMSIRDGAGSPTTAPVAAPSHIPSRLAAAVNLFTDQKSVLLRQLADMHDLHLYRFDANAVPIGTAPTTQPARDAVADQSAALNHLSAEGQTTQFAESLRAVHQDLQGQRVAGVVILTDGRDTPQRPLAAALAEAKDWGVRLYPVALGSDRPPVNVEIESADAQPAAFVGDYVAVHTQLRGTGVGAGRQVTLRLLDKSTHSPVLGEDGQPVESKVSLADDTPTDAELLFRPTHVGTLDLLVEAQRLPDQADQRNSTQPIQISVLDSRISVLYVEGYPRWDYRYVKNALIRDKTVEISCLLTSADPDFAQEGTRPITRFPENMQELMGYDVVLFGDVDPRQFSDAQLQLINDYVATKGGGFGMVAGPRYSPAAYKGTPIELLLPVNIAATSADPDAVHSASTVSAGFRLVPTRLGLASSIFRPFADPERNARFFAEQLPPLFWYCRNITVKPGVGEVFAEHPTELAPDGRKAPLLVLGRFGSGRTLFSAIDDSWRWRFYTGEQIFDTYWVQQLRQLALGRKAGQRRLSFRAARTAVDLGQQVRATLRILDSQLVSQLPDTLPVKIVDAATGQVVRVESLQRQPGSSDLYNLSYTADAVGGFTLRLDSPDHQSNVPITAPIEVTVPRLEFTEPRPDTDALGRLAAETGGKLLDVANAAQSLPKLIPSAAKIIPVDVPEPLYGAPIALVLIASLLTTEWLLRKFWGMV